jgi:hypothetical protein
MQWQFNPFTGNMDRVGGGSSTGGTIIGSGRGETDENGLFFEIVQGATVNDVYIATLASAEAELNIGADYGTDDDQDGIAVSIVDDGGSPVSSRQFSWVVIRPPA